MRDDEQRPHDDAGTRLTVGAPVGRALLHWRGKQHPGPVPVEHPVPVESFGATDGNTGSLFHGDNRSVLAHLLASGYRNQVRLIYIDPPFDSAADYARPVRLRDAGGRKVGSRVEYSDTWADDSYLQFMYERLLLLRDLLAEDGSIWLHCDYRQVHRLHLLLEEVFGLDNYLNTIAWRSQVTRGAKVDAFYFPFSTQYIEIFAKNRRAPTVWTPQRKQLVFTRRQAANRFMEDEQGFFRTSDPGTYSFDSLLALHAAGRLYAPFSGDIVVHEAERRISCSNGGNLGIKYYLTPLEDGRFAVARGVDNLWDDIPGLGTTPGEDVAYPTQKTEALLRRVIGAGSNPGDLVLDCFAGSGTTLTVAEQMGRRWIGCDANYGSIQVTRRRLQRLIQGRQTGGFTVLTAAAGDDASATGTNPPPTAHVEIGRQAGERATIDVRVHGVQSARLTRQLQRGKRPVEVTDPLTLIEAVEIDPRYDGRHFRPTLVDAPHKKRTRVNGLYRIPVPNGLDAAPSVTAGAAAGAVTVAVRITDILGDEVLVCATV